ncbi:MAG: leucine-rich repeat protein [Clostridia bacterium]|nr:leucine-rich repeat protein [Clostridia bacterium]
MKKRYLVLALLVLIALALPLIAGADTSGACGNSLTWTLTDSGVLTISGSGTMTDYDTNNRAPWGTSIKKVTIVQGVTSIGQEAFHECRSLMNATIPNSVTKIGYQAFSYCNSLTSATIPDSVTSIGEGAFYNCTSLTSARIPDGVTSISKNAFSGCQSLTSLTIGNSVTSIGEGAFNYCTSLTRMTIPNSVKIIGNYAFHMCHSVTSLTIPDSVTSIGRSAFESCDDLTSVKIGNGVTSISYYAFSGCTSLTSLMIGNNVTSIGEGAFRSCKSLTNVTIPNSVTSIGVNAFRICESLTSMTIPNSVTNIGNEAFSGCSRLMSVTIPNSVTSIGSSAFYGCSSNLTISCYAGSTAQQYAEANNINVILLDAKPTITTQPTNKTVNEGAKATFKVVATGATGYQWYYRKPDNSTWYAASNGGTSATYTLTTEARHNGYKYRVKVSNSAGYVYSNIVTLTVNLKPVITTQPTNQKVNEGAKATFKVVATNADTYQWYYLKPNDSTWNAVSNNGTSATYSLTTAARHNGYKYHVKVSNSAGSVWSNDVTLTVTTATKPTITTQPTNQNVNEGAKATFKVVATNADTYQWHYQKPNDSTWTAVSNNGTSATYTLTTAARHNGYKYKVKVSNSAGYVWSNVVTLTVTTATKPTITTQPTNKTVNEGANATFKVVATGATGYQWHYQKPNDSTWTAVSNNGTSATYTLTTAARHNGYKYRVKVSNSAGYVWSNTVTLTVNLKPVITEQPANVTVAAGSKATFKIYANGATSYQWYYQKPGENTWNKVSNNGTSATYTLTVAARHNGYKYKCVVTNAVGSVESIVVTLTVK